MTVNPMVHILLSQFYSRMKVKSLKIIQYIALTGLAL